VSVDCFLKFMGTYNPWHPHCGPFNAVSKKRSRDPVDEACRQHDIGYGKIGNKAYFYHNRYDDEFIKRLKTKKGFLPLFYRKVFEAKKALAPSLPEKMSNFPPTPPRKRSMSNGDSMNLDVPMSSNMAQQIVNRITRRYNVRPSSFSQKMARLRPFLDTRRKGRSRRGAKKRRSKRTSRKRSGRKRKTSMKFKRRRNRSGIVNRRGSVKKVENGGFLACEVRTSLYLGHGLAANEAGKAMCRALVKEIMRQRKTDFLDWDEQIAEFAQADVNRSKLTTYIYLIKNPGIGQAETATTLVPGNDAGGGNYTLTYNQYADNIWSHLQDSLGTTDAQSFISRIQVNDNNQSGVALPVAKIQGSQFYINFSYVSNLKIQNRTTADPHGSPDVNEDTTIDISTNPLVGKIYRSRRHWRNGVILAKGTKAVDNTSTTGEGAYSMTADKDTGLIKFTGASQFPGQNQVTTTKILQKPPPGWMFQCKDSPISMAPGAYATSKHRFKCRMGLDSFCQKLFPIIAVNTDNYQQLMLGWADVVGLERYMDTVRNSYITKVGFQIDQTYMCHGTYKSLKTAPIISSGNDPIQANYLWYQTT